MTGLDDPAKLKSIKVEKGYFKILWFEELADFNGMEEIRSVRQSVVRGGENFIVLASYNPPKDPNSWVNKECTKDIPDRMIHTSNYLDVPRSWLGEQFFKDAESLKSVDPDKYEHEYMGVPTGQSERLVFNGKWEEKVFKTPPVSEIYQSRFFYGADWGFANDPTVLLRCFIIKDNEGSDLYIDYDVGGVGVDFPELPDLFDAVPDAQKWKIYADCARPETISYMVNQRYNIVPVKKWKGSIEDGVSYIRSFRRIYIHPRCKGTIKDFKNHAYKIDKNTQEILPIMIDEFNNYIDSIRYALSDYIIKKVSILDVL
jgi:phage terminase large subunit